MGLFLPFTPNGRATELRAIEVKRLLDLPPAVAVDPNTVLARIPARLVEPRELWESAPDLARSLFVDNGDSWSGMVIGRSPVDGAALILLNPADSAKRRRATLMEEVVHLVLAHPPSCISQDGSV